MKFTHSGYEFDTEKFYLYGNNVVKVGYRVDCGVMMSFPRGANAQLVFPIPEKDLHTLREVTIGEPVEQKFVPRKGQAVLVSDDGEDWCVRIFQELVDGKFSAVSHLRNLSSELAGSYWKFCKPLPEEMK